MKIISQKSEKQISGSIFLSKNITFLLINSANVIYIIKSFFLFFR